jgi:hypothetical protein
VSSSSLLPALVVPPVVVAPDPPPAAPASPAARPLKRAFSTSLVPVAREGTSYWTVHRVLQQFQAYFEADHFKPTEAGEELEEKVSKELLKWLVKHSAKDSELGQDTCEEIVVEALYGRDRGIKIGASVERKARARSLKRLVQCGVMFWQSTAAFEQAICNYLLKHVDVKKNDEIDRLIPHTVRF